MINTAEEFVLLRKSEDPKDYLRAANEDADLAVWREVIDRFPEMSIWVAHNKTVPLPVLEALADSADPSVRHMVAMKNCIPDELIARLAGDSDPSVRQRIAYNKNASREVLEALACDPEQMVASVASNRLSANK